MTAPVSPGSPGRPVIDTAEPIIVVLDDTRGSSAALRWAADHAASVGTGLMLITAYSPPHASLDIPFTTPEMHELTAADVRHRSAEIAIDVLGRETYERTPHLVAAGDIGRLLAEHESTASMIVVATPRHRRWWHPLHRPATWRIASRMSLPVMSIPAADVTSREIASTVA